MQKTAAAASDFAHVRKVLTIGKSLAVLAK